MRRRDADESPVPEADASALDDLDQPATPKAVGAAALWSVGNAVAGQGISLLAFLITARFISPEAFGVVAIATLVIELVKRSLIEPLAIRLTAMNNPDLRAYDESFSHIVILSVFGLLAVVALAVPLAALTDLPQLPTVLYVMSAMMVTIALGRVYEVWHVKRFEFRVLAIRSMIAAVVGGATGVGMALAGFGLWSLVAQQLVTSAVTYLLIFAFSQWQPKFRLAIRDSFRELFEGRHFIYTAVVGFGGTQADVFFVTSTVGAYAGGLYSAAKRLILAANLIIVNSLNNVILASFAERNRSDRAYQFHLDSLEIYAVAITPLFVGLALLSHDVIALLLSPAWLASSPILAALSIAALGTGLGAVVTNFLIAANADRARTAVIVGTTLLTVAALPFVSTFGAVTVAWFMAGAAWVALIAFNVVAAARSGVSQLQPIQVLLLPLAGAAAMVGAYHLVEINASPLLRLLIVPPLLFLVYLIVVGGLGFATKARAASHFRSMLRRVR